MPDYVMQGPIKYERVAGGVRITHPSGLVVVETDEERMARREQQRAAASLAQQLVDNCDALCAHIDALNIVE